jgi:hypothetical protein
MKITRRDVKFFFFGVLTMILLEVVLNWQDFKSGLQEGYNAAKQNTEISE